MEYATRAPRRWTVQEVYNLPADGNRYEVVHGELLVTPAPRTRHQALVIRLLGELLPYLSALGLRDTLYPGPADYFYGDDVYMQPDLLVCRPDEISGDWRTMKHLRLAVEVLSLTSIRADRVVKRGAHQEAGTETYWVVDADHRRVEVWRPGDNRPRVVTKKLRWRVTRGAPELVIEVPALFDSLPE